MMIRTAVTVAAALLLAGCSHGNSAPPFGAIGQSLPHDAKVIADRVAAKIGPTVTSVTVNTDPTKPAVADSEAVISDSRVEYQDPKPGADNGAKVEVYASSADAQARIDYLQKIAKAAPMLGDSYDATAGDVVFRVSGHMPIDGVGSYKMAWATVTDGG